MIESLLVIMPDRIYQFTIHATNQSINNIFQVSSDPVEDVVNFIRSYEERYGNIHPVFYQGSYSQALSDAKQELRFLLVYLHKDEAQDIDQWCR